MSRFTGKTDLYDWFGSIACLGDETPFECYKRLGSELYVNGIATPVEINKPSDLVLFYPFDDAVHDYSRRGKDKHFLTRGSNYADMISYNPTGVAHGLQDLLDEYWRVKNEEDPKYS